MNKRPHTHWLLLVLPLLFLVLFYFYPLIKIVLVSFAPESTWEPGHLRQLVNSAGYFRILRFTFWQAALSTLLTLLFALPGAFVFARYRFPLKNLLQALMTVPFVLPTVVTAAAFLALLGPGGLVNDTLMRVFALDSPPIRLDQSAAFFLLAHIFYNYSLVLRIVSGYWTRLDPHQKEAATMLGASPLRTFFKITLPLLMPPIGSAALLVFIFCFTSFGVVLILGGPGCATIEVEIYRQSIQLFNLPMAAALSLIQIFINFLLMLLHARLGRNSRIGFFSSTSGEAPGQAVGFLQKILLAINLAFMVILLLTPLLALLLRSFLGDHGLTLAYYRALLTTPPDSLFVVPPVQAVLNSIGFAVLSMGMAVLLGLLASSYLAHAGNKKNNFVNLWDSIIMLPLATSAVTLGFGYIITLNTPPLNLRDSLALIPVAHTLVAFPFVVRCILPSIRQIPENIREAAALSGNSPRRVWRKIDLPLLTRPIMVGAVFAFSISMGEFGASTFVARPHTPTMPVAIFRFLGQPGDMNYGQAMAMSTILMAVTTIAFWLLGKTDKEGMNS
ncbi:ABC transporter permease [Desulfomarina sp.]